MRVWASRFPDADTAEKYANNPEKYAQQRKMILLNESLLLSLENK